MASPPGTVIGRLRIKVLPDTSEFRDKLFKDLEKIEKSLGDIEVGIKADLDEASFRAARTRADRIAGGGIKVPVIGAGGRDGSSTPGGGLAGTRGVLALLTNPAIIGTLLGIALAGLSPLIGALVVVGGLITAAGVATAPLILGFQGAVDAADDLKPRLTGLPEQLSPIIEGVTKPLIDSLNNAAPIISNGFIRIASGLRPIAQDIADSFTEATDNGQLERIFRNIDEFLARIDESDAFGKITDFLLNIAESGTEALPDSFTAFADGITDAAASIQEIVDDGTVDDAIEDFNSIATSLDAIATAIAAVIKISTEFNNAIFGTEPGADPFSATAINNALISINDALITFNVTFGQYFEGALFRAVDAVVGWSTAVNTYVLGVLSRAQDSAARFSASIDAAIGLAVAAASRLATGFRDSVNQAVAYVLGLPGSITSALSGINLFSIGFDIIKGLQRGIESAIPSVKGVLDLLTASIPDWKGPPERDRKLLRPAANDIIGGFTDQLRRNFADVKATLALAPIELDIPGQRAATGLQQVFQVDPRTDDDYVARVSEAAGRAASRVLTLRYARV